MIYKLTRDEFDKLSDELKKEYKEDGESFVLSIEGDGAPDPSAFERIEKKRQLEIEHRKRAEKDLEEAEARAAKLQKDLEKAKNSGDIEEITRRHNEQLEEIRKQREEEQSKFRKEREDALKAEERNRFLGSHLVGGAEQDLCELVADRYASRLSVEEIGGQQVVRVLDKDGKPSALSIGELEKEFLDNPSFSKVVRVKAGSGGGAIPGSQGGGAPTKKSLKEMSAKEEAEFEKSDPEGYQAALDEL